MTSHDYYEGFVFSDLISVSHSEPSIDLQNDSSSHSRICDDDITDWQNESEFVIDTADWQNHIENAQDSDKNSTNVRDESDEERYPRFGSPLGPRSGPWSALLRPLYQIVSEIDSDSDTNVDPGELDTPELYGWLRRAAFKSEGFGDDTLNGRPIVGICNTWSELTHCNSHLRELADSVIRGVWQAGGFALEFPVMSLGEFNMRPTTMLYRNLMSMDVEESITANPLYGVVPVSYTHLTLPTNREV